MLNGMFGGMETLPGYGNPGWTLGDPMCTDLQSLAGWHGESALAKAMDSTNTLGTGSGVVAVGATGGQTFRPQFLKNTIEDTSFTNEDAVFWNLIPKKPVRNTTVEWTIRRLYGAAGHGFAPEAGPNGDYTGNGAADQYLRKAVYAKFMGTQRQWSQVMAAVDNIEDPEAASDKAAALELAGKANFAMYWGDSKLDANMWDGIWRQCFNWLHDYPDDQEILIDAGGRPIDEVMLQSTGTISMNKFGRISKLLQSPVGGGDTMNMLYPKERFTGGQTNGSMGVDRRIFNGPQGDITILRDPMLRPNKPLRVDGPGSDGAPRTSATCDFTVAWSASPFSTAPVGGTPGAGNSFENITLQDTVSLITSPALPTANGSNNATNRLAAGYYYYAVSVVLDGQESEPYVYGNTGVANGFTGSGGSPTGVQITTGQSMLILVDCDGNPTMTCTGTSIAGTPVTFSGITTATRNRFRFRLYRYDGGAGNTAPSSIADFKYLMEFAPYSGSVSSGGAAAFDNGFWMPNTDTAVAYTEAKNSAQAGQFCMMLPLMSILLPRPLWGLLKGWLLFGTPVWWAPRHHCLIRNIGRA